jgi:hypothetical protein
MRTIFFVVLLCALVSDLKAQYSIEVSTGADDLSRDIWVYVGTLRNSSSGNSEKLKIEVLGGHWVNSNGETTYYVSDRDMLAVNQVTMGSTNSNQFRLRAFNSSEGYDYYIYTPWNTYAAYSVKSCIVGGTNVHLNLTGNGSSQQLVQCTVQAITPPGLPSTGAEQTLNINPVMITDAGGNIGLNTANPDPNYKLSVNGVLRAKQIIVDAGWSDYVFDKDYKLLPLTKVEAYIKENRHLPEIPTTIDIKQKGVNIGETDSLFLKKIEELTLYIIELSKQLQEQGKKIEILENLMINSKHQ